MLNHYRHDKVEALRCIRCATDYPASYPIDSRGCPRCYSTAPSNLIVRYKAEAIKQRAFPSSGRGRGLGRFEAFLPVNASETVTLCEGDTALVRADRLERELGIGNLWIKDEGRNPTWSHKDRFSAIAVSHALQSGAKLVATASSGNAGASLAAYAAKAGIKCLVATFAGAAGPMVEQIHRYGAMVATLSAKELRWPFLDEGHRRFGWFITSPFSAPVVGSNPYGIEGYKTIAYEIFEQMDGAIPDWIIVPVAYGDVIAGIARGFEDLANLGLTNQVPRLVAAEVHGSIGETLLTGSHAIAKVTAKAPSKALSIGTVQSTFQALDAVTATRGTSIAIADSELFEAQALLSTTEGMFGELSSAITVAAAAKLRRHEQIGKAESVVCLLTASGLKDLDQTTMPKEPFRPLSGDMTEALDFLQQNYAFSP